MNCQEALNLLYDIIDKEASEIDEKAVEEHLSHCHHCSEIYRLESTVNDFIQAKLQRSVSNERLESLRSRIVVELDNLEQPEKSGKKKIPFSRMTMLVAAAASLVLLIGMALVASNFYKHQTDLVPLERAHWEIHNNMSQYVDTELTTAIVNRAADDMQYEISPAVGEFELAGANVKELFGVPMSHFVYRSGDRFVSVFLVPVDKFDLPSSLQDHEVLRDNINFYDHFCRGCRLVFHRMGDVLVITATTEKDVELLDFIPGHTAI